MGRLWALLGTVLYVAFLGGVILYGALAYAHLVYPEPVRLPAPAAVEYHSFVQDAGTVVAVLLGLWAAMVLRWLPALPGVLGVLGGAALTAAALNLMPAIYFPSGPVPAGMLWLTGKLWLMLSVAAVGWSLFRPRRRRRVPRPLAV